MRSSLASFVMGITLPALMHTSVANARDLDAELRTLETSFGSSYVRARDSLVQQVRLQPSLRDQLQPELNVEQNWRRAILVEAALMRATNAGVDAQLQNINGVQPEFYLKRRAPRPTAATDIKRARIAAPVLMESYLKTFDTLPRTAVSRYPATLTRDKVTSLQNAEREALRHGILLAVGSARHAASAAFLSEIALDQTTDVPTRRTAVIALGRTGRGSDTIERILLNNEDDALTTAALSAAGSLRNQAGLNLLKRYAANSADPIARHAALLALGPFASARTWRSRLASANAETLRSGAAKTLIRELHRANPAHVDSGLLQAIAAADHPAIWQAVYGLPSSPLAEQARRYAAMAEGRR